jgi:hypothetical protein
MSLPTPTWNLGRRDGGHCIGRSKTVSKARYHLGDEGVATEPCFWRWLSGKQFE